jgi:hypothetical protein
MRQSLALLMRQEIDAGIGSVINDVTDHLVPEEAFLHLQVAAHSKFVIRVFKVETIEIHQISTPLFSLALGSDTSKNSTQTKYDFTQLGVKVELPRAVFTMTDRPLVVSFVWLQGSNHLDPPALNGEQQLPSLIDRGT